jgi:hypothetical protein
VCDIIGHHHHPRSQETINFRVLYDADLITNLEGKKKRDALDSAQLQDVIDKSLMTAAGKEEARRVLVKERRNEGEPKNN